jgi:hypothetical protein
MWSLLCGEREDTMKLLFQITGVLITILVVGAGPVLANKGKGQEKKDVCHYREGTGDYMVLNIASPAVPAHLAHGDVMAGVFYSDVDGDGFGDPAGETDVCPNPGFVDNDDDAFPNDPNENADSDGDGIGDNSDECPDEPGLPEYNGCPPPPTSFLGSDLVIGKAGEFGHKGNMAMLFGDGTGGFDLDIIELNEFEQNHEVAVGDVNNDGKDDVVVVYSKGQVHVALGGNFSDGLQNSDLTPAGAFTEGANNCCNRTRVLQLGDLNNDGNLDIAVTMWSKMGAMLGNGDGTFGPEIQSPSTGFDARGMALGDLDGDGILDLVANHAPGSWWLAFHHGNGDGTFQPVSIISNSDLAIPNTKIVDMDGDGILDVVSGSLESRFKIFYNDGSANFTGTDIGLGSVGGLLIADDLNGDEDPDIMTTTDVNNYTVVRVTLSDGNGGFLAPTDYGPVGSLPRHAVIADVNEDGLKDVAMVTVNIFDSDGNDSTCFLLGNGDGTFDAPYCIDVFRNNYTIDAGNFE